ncbi:MAG: hypothetical protein LBT00_14230 [Spirochaetaceae bacterium]|nr:hypothetical protein [Spirochaetaceae bacterium]
MKAFHGWIASPYGFAMTTPPCLGEDLRLAGFLEQAHVINLWLWAFSPARQTPVSEI